MTSVSRVYSSTDPGAPQLSGVAGSLVAVLDAVLVDGYGSAANAKPGAGWTKALVGTNKRAYRNDPVAGSGFHLQVDDSGSVGSARQAVVRGYAQMTAFDAGMTPVPTPQVLPSGVPVAKSSQLSGVSTAWVIIADSRFFYLFVNPWINRPSNRPHPYFFGDFISYKPGDMNCWCLSRNGLVSFDGSGDVDGYVFSTDNTPATLDVNRAAIYLPDTYSSPSAPALAHLVGGSRSGGWRPWGSNALDSSVYPNPVTQGLIYSNAFIYEERGMPRGELPGLLVPRHNKPFVDRQPMVPPLEYSAHTAMIPITFAIEVWDGVSSQDLLGQLVFLEGGSWWE